MVLEPEKRADCGSSGFWGFDHCVFQNLETVPYTNRKHFVLLSRSMERKLGEMQFENMKAAFKGKILLAIHPKSVRVRLIGRDIIGALQRGLRNEKVWSDLEYASESVGGVHEAKAHEILMALKDNEEGKWFTEDEILDDEWVHQSKKKGLERGSQPETSQNSARENNKIFGTLCV